MLEQSRRCALNPTELRGKFCISVRPAYRGFRHGKCQKSDILDGFLAGMMEKRKNARWVRRIFGFRLPAENCKRENSQEDISLSATAEREVSFFDILITQVYHYP